MGAAAAPVALPHSIASAGLKAYGDYEAGVGKSEAAKYKARPCEQNAQRARVSAVQTGAAESAAARHHARQHRRGARGGPWRSVLADGRWPIATSRKARA